jgi:hypothetical protein
MPSWSSEGKIGGSYYFDGGDYMKVNHSESIGSDFNLTANFTIDMWINLSDTMASTHNVIFEKANSTKNIILINYDNGSGPDLWFEFRNDEDSTTQLKVYDWKPSSNTWWHATFRYNGTGMAIFLNGTHITSNSKTGSVYNVDQYIDIGARNTLGGSTAYQFKGSLDNIRIWNRSLSDDQIAQLYSDGANSDSNHSIIVGEETYGGENWTCQITPSDGTYDGTTKENSTTIGSCDYVRSGLTLASDSTSCYEFDQDDATLDCDNHIIFNGFDTYWMINATKRDSVLVKDCYMQNGTKGIIFESTNNSRIESITIFNFSHFNSDDVYTVGILLDKSSTANTIKHVNMTNLSTTGNSGGCYSGTLEGILIDTDSHDNFIENITFENITGTYYDTQEFPGCSPYIQQIGKGTSIEDSDNNTVFKCYVFNEVVM